MATIINNPSGGDSSHSGVGLIIGIVLALVVIVLFFIYGLPALRNLGGGGGGTNINVTLPEGTPGGGATE